MLEYILKEKELLTKLNSELNELKIFMLGNIVREENDTDKKPSECLQDEVIDNLNSVDYALKQVDIIKTAIKGGK